MGGLASGGSGIAGFGSGGAGIGNAGTGGSVIIAASPIVGTWHEEARYDCTTGAEIPAAPAPIREVVFSNGGNFSVTWTPFEWYNDYEGTYVIDLEAGTIEMTIQKAASNYVPPDADLTGRVQVENGTRLILRDVWLGTDQAAEATRACGHRLGR